MKEARQKSDNRNKSSIISEWVEKFSDDLYSWALYKTSSKDIAEDLIQETFIASIHSYETFREESSPKTWLFTILNRKIIDHYRKNAKLDMVSLESGILNNSFEDGAWKQSKMEQTDLDTELLDNSEFLKIYQMCLDALAPKWALVMHQKFILNKKSKEMCQELGITESNLWQIVHRSKLKLKDCLTTNWDEN